MLLNILIRIHLSEALKPCKVCFCVHSPQILILAAVHPEKVDVCKQKNVSRNCRLVDDGVIQEDMEENDIERERRNEHRSQCHTTHNREHQTDGAGDADQLRHVAGVYQRFHECLACGSKLRCFGRREYSERSKYRQKENKAEENSQKNVQDFHKRAEVIVVHSTRKGAARNARAYTSTTSV